MRSANCYDARKLIFKRQLFKKFMNSSKQVSRLQRMNDEQMRTIKEMLAHLGIDFDSNFIQDFLGLERKTNNYKSDVQKGVNELQQVLITAEDLLPLYSKLKDLTEELENERKRVREYIEKAEEFEKEMEKINQEKADLIAKMQQPEKNDVNSTMHDTKLEDSVMQKQSDLFAILSQKKSQITSLETQIHQVKYQIKALEEDIKILKPSDDVAE